MDTSGMRSHFVVDIEEGTEFVSNFLKVTGLISIFCLAGISVHGIRNPQDRFAFALNGADETGEILA
ncbi:unnamed protein product [Pseudo-nitzschia multistriata]|uniref:Uncharacterized protein n=1 Tax=Pseudo-nitzschia multistriata TaxID=183589 RepID=A0A448YYM2_9STRA|nr:unnamed protein product [Pseudo-nitzschia multistriata]